MKRFIPLFLVITLAAWPLIAESTWEGTSAVSKYGEFPESGNYGASNSFAVNTTVTVKNLENGKETTVIIVDRLENPGLFLLVSRDAAQELGLSSGDISRVQASIAVPEGSVTTFPDDLPFNPDPDINPAASVSTYADILESIIPADIAETGTTDTRDTDVADTTEADTTDTSDTAVTDIADTDATDTRDTDVADTTDTAVVEAVDEGPPKINGVDPAIPPVEEATPTEVADEPTPPAEEEDPVTVSELDAVDDAGDAEPRLVVETPPDPRVGHDEAPLVLDLMPAPVLDQTEKFVLLAEPDVPDVSDLVETREPELEEALRISALDEPTAIDDTVLEAIIPPEPVFEERIADVEEPVAEDILIVSELIEPDSIAEAPFDMPSIADEPALSEDVVDIPVVSALDMAEAGEEETVPVASDTPAVVEDLSFDEPVFVAGEEEPAEAEDILIVTELKTVPDPDETLEALAVESGDEPVVTDVEPEADEDIPVVVNGFSPPVYDPDEIDIVLEPAEPRPPEPRIAGSDLLDTATGMEPGTDVEVAEISEPVPPEEREPEVKETPDEARIVETKTAVADEIPPTRIASEDVAKPEVTEKPEVAVAVGQPDVEQPVTEPAVKVPDVTTTLSDESYYLQLAAFTEANAAANLQEDLAEIYPVTVYLTESAERRVYKVLVGPLNQDESGALLVQFRIRGFPDAFVRAGAVN
jgi:hypothetical protein